MTVKYPLPCGCAGPKYISMCDTHKLMAQRLHARDLGIDRLKAERLLKRAVEGLDPVAHCILIAEIQEFLGE